MSNWHADLRAVPTRNGRLGDHVWVFESPDYHSVRVYTPADADDRPLVDESAARGMLALYLGEASMCLVPKGCLIESINRNIDARYVIVRQCSYERAKTMTKMDKYIGQIVATSVELPKQDPYAGSRDSDYIPLDRANKALSYVVCAVQFLDRSVTGNNANAPVAPPGESLRDCAREIRKLLPELERLCARVDK